MAKQTLREQVRVVIAESAKLITASNKLVSGLKKAQRKASRSKSKVRKK